MMMKDEGKYLYLWMKYAPAIRVLLKKTENEAQRLQLYKHEFENGGSKLKPGYNFSFEIAQGKVIRRPSTTSVGGDLLKMIDEQSEIREFLKDRHVRFTMEKNFELQLEKV